MPSNSGSLPKIWFARVGQEHHLLEHQVLEQLSSSEHDRLQSIKSKSKCHEYLLSRALMRHALSQQFGQSQQDWVFVEKSSAPPIVENLPEGYWLSLSHSHGVICFALHNKPVGIDIEKSKIRNNFTALAEAFMTEDELELLHSSENQMADNFYKIWCAKEAFYKMLAPSDQQGLFMKKINYFDLTNGQNSCVKHGNIEEYHLALVTKTALGNVNELAAGTFDGAIKIQWAWR